jgi:hypothetical protein
MIETLHWYKINFIDVLKNGNDIRFAFGHSLQQQLQPYTMARTYSEFQRTELEKIWITCSLRVSSHPTPNEEFCVRIWFAVTSFGVTYDNPQESAVK